MSDFRSPVRPSYSLKRQFAFADVKRASGSFAASARSLYEEFLNPPIFVPLTAAAAIAAYGFYLRLY
jgi:hypothetical protein